MPNYKNNNKKWILKYPKHFLFLKKKNVFFSTLVFRKLRAIIPNMRKKPKPLMKKETSDVLSSRIILNEWKTIYAFKLKCKKVLLGEMYDMKNFLKQVNLVSNIIITKNKLIKIFILNILYSYFTERRNITEKKKYNWYLLSW